MQLFMPFHQADIIAIQQPINLLPRQRHQFIIRAWPAEFLFGQAFVIEHKSVVFPVQQFNLIASAIGKGVQTTLKRVVPQLLFDNGRKAPETFPVMWCTT